MLQKYFILSLLLITLLTINGCTTHSNTKTKMPWGRQADWENQNIFTAGGAYIPY